MAKKGYSSSSCELCSNPARMFCESDEASLCWECDQKVHAANFLVAKHSRTLLCHVCHSHTAWTAAGLNIGPTVSLCRTCAEHGDSQTTNSMSGEEESIQESETDDYCSSSSSSEEEEDEAEEEGENQVVPLATSSASSTSTTEEEEAGVSSSSLKRMRDNPGAEQEGCCSSENLDSNLCRGPDRLSLELQSQENFGGSSALRPLKMRVTSNHGSPDQVVDGEQRNSQTH